MRSVVNGTGGRWICALIAAAFCGGALADRDHDHDHYHRGYDPHHDRYYGRGDIHRFYVHDYPRWRGGSWYHGYHGGRSGWWWTVDGFWYSYPQPIYPYPDPYTPPVVMQQPPVYEGREDQERGDEEQQPPPAQNWYYCNSSRNYYPYVSACPEGWQTVPATPPDAPDQ